MAALAVATAIRGVGNVLDGVAAGAGGDTFINSGQEIFVVKNGSGAGITVTFATPTTIDGLAVSNLDVSVGAGVTRSIGPFPSGWYNDTAQPGGIVSVSYSAVTTVTVAVLKVTPA